jgi:hypothetical protein
MSARRAGEDRVNIHSAHEWMLDPLRPGGRG